jgi:hypothetical protein
MGRAPVARAIASRRSRHAAGLPHTTSSSSTEAGSAAREPDRSPASHAAHIGASASPRPRRRCCCAYAGAWR